MAIDLGGLLSQFLGGGAAPANTPEHFEKVAQNAPPDLVSEGLSAMFRSDQTPPFSQMAGQLFGNATPAQQAGMLNQLLAAMGPTVLASLAGGTAAGSPLGGLLGRLTQGGAAAPATITPEDASKLTPEQVQVIASHAEQHNPGIVDQMSSFYAQHSSLIKTLGGAALTIALAKMAERNKA